MEAPVSAPASNGSSPASRSVASEANKRELAETLARKVAQGFEIESESERHAVLVMKGRRRWLGLSNRPSVRYELTVDDGGTARSRRL